MTAKFAAYVNIVCNRLKRTLIQAYACMQRQTCHGTLVELLLQLGDWYTMTWLSMHVCICLEQGSKGLRFVTDASPTPHSDELGSSENAARYGSTSS